MGLVSVTKIRGNIHIECGEKGGSRFKIKVETVCKAQTKFYQSQVLPRIDDHQRSTIEIIIWRSFKINRPLAMTPWLGNEGKEVYINGISKTIMMFAKVGGKAQIRSSGTIGLAARVEITSSDGDGPNNVHGLEFCPNKLRSMVGGKRIKIKALNAWSVTLRSDVVVDLIEGGPGVFHIQKTSQQNDVVIL